jgi:hypothetical protein
MKKNILISTLAGIFIIYLNSCAPLYVPNVVNTPMLSEKNDFNASVNFGLSGTDIQSAYAVTDNIGIMLNGSYMNETSDSTDNFHKHIFIEAGAGYFKPLGKFGLFEAYGGYGLGKINSYQSSDVFFSYADTYVNRFFIQPSIGFKSNYFQLAFAPRTVCAFVSQENVNKTGFFIEPTLILKAGSPMIKFITQFGLSFMLNDYSNSFNYEPFLFSFGLQFSLRNRESEKKF